MLVQVDSGTDPARVQAALSMALGVAGRSYDGFTGEYLLINTVYLTTAVHRCHPIMLRTEFHFSKGNTTDPNLFLSWFH